MPDDGDLKMGSVTDAEIASWQKETGIEPATGERLEALDELSMAAFELIKLIELERTGIRDGDGGWHGSDMVGHMLDDLHRRHRRLMDSYRDESEEEERRRRSTKRSPRF